MWCPSSSEFAFSYFVQSLFSSQYWQRGSNLKESLGIEDETNCQIAILEKRLSNLMDVTITGRAGFPTSLSPYVGAVMFETLLYGLYVMLFAVCTYVLRRRNNTLHRILLASAGTMFALATSDILYTYYLLFGKLLKGEMSLLDVRPKYWLFVTNNVLADALLLYRCYVVWERNKVVILGPVALLIAATVCGYIFEGSNSALFERAWIYLIMTLVLNITLTSLTAGRLWWRVKQAREILGRSLLQRYNASIMILIESGAVYSLYVILDLAFRNHDVGSIVLDAGLIQVVGIMPTLIIVQVGLGRAIHDIEANKVEEEGDKTPSVQSHIHFVHPRDSECHHARAESSSETSASMADENAHEEHLGEHGQTMGTQMDAIIDLTSFPGLLPMDRAESLRLSWEDIEMSSR